MHIVLRAAGVKHRENVLTNGFTLSSSICLYDRHQAVTVKKVFDDIKLKNPKFDNRCNIRIPVGFSVADCDLIGEII